MICQGNDTTPALSHRRGQLVITVNSSGKLLSSSKPSAVTRNSPDVVNQADWMVERGGFEPPVPLRLTWAEFGPSSGHYYAQIRASVLERICSPGSALLRISPVPFVRQADARNLGDVEHEMKVWSSNLHSLGGQSAKASPRLNAHLKRTALSAENDFPR
jgi:hypothetical protein